MSLAGHQSPPIFKRGPAPQARLLLFVIVCLAMLIADLRFHYLEVMRKGLSIVTHPLQVIAAAPVNFVHNAATYFSTLAEVQLENADLRRFQRDSAQRLLRFEQIEHENQELRKLLAMSATITGRSIAADILYDGPDPFVRRVILDRGANHGIEAGLAVIDAYGMIGQITRIYPTQAEVTLVTDKEQAIPVQVERSGVRGILYGNGQGLLELRFAASDSDIQEGDRLVTSGMDGIFLPGLPVATVISIKTGGSIFAFVLGTPIAHANRARQVLVLAREPMGPPRPNPVDALDVDAAASVNTRETPPAGTASGGQ